jgi:2,3-bisphosphoglycerate-independent phosphoglycerate mutase
MDQETSVRGGRALAEAVRRAYLDGQTDYTMEPLVQTLADGTPAGAIEPGDAVIFCCRRGEREIELTDAFTAADFPHFERKPLDGLSFVILTMYHEKYTNLPIAFAPSKIEETLAQCVSAAGLRQLHCAESEKFAHVTFFFNGGNNQAFPGEDDIRIPSPKGVPFDQVPGLSLPEVADKVIGGIQSGYEFIVTNFANGDVIGHTTNTDAKIECARIVDTHLGRVVEAAKQQGYVVAITADHGNLEAMLTGDGKPHVAHTANLVNFLLIDPQLESPLSLDDGSLCDVAPTVLQVLDIPQPEQMTGKSLAGGAHDFGKSRRVLLIILDGWGIGKSDGTNPIHIADTPVWDGLIAAYPPSKLRASGDAVGLQEGKAGNSEAGHLNLGSGRVVQQDDVRLDSAMKDGSFEKNEVFLRTIEDVKKRGKTLHLLALLTKKSSHGSIDYPLALLRMAKQKGLADICVHIIFDGRSTEPGSAPALLEDLEDQMQKIGVGRIVDGTGRGIVLDRDGNFAKIKKAYDALVYGKGRLYQ